MKRVGALLAAVVFSGVFFCTGESASAEDSNAPKGSKELFTLQDTDITESSGLATSAVHDGVVYTINDSGHSADIYAINSKGSTEATLRMRFVEPRDWEAIAAGPDQRIWVGDIGDNDKVRETVTLYRFREPSTLESKNLEYGRYRFKYPDGAHDAEALLVHPQTGRIYIVTKEIDGGAIYRGPEEAKAGSVNSLTKMADAPPVITDGSFLPDGSGVVLRNYSQAFLLDWPSAKVDREIATPAQKMAESLTVSRDGKRLMVGGEGTNSAVWSVPVDGPAPNAAPSPSAKASASTSPDTSGGKDSGESSNSGGSENSILGGMPSWVPLTVLAIAVIAGIAAFPRGRRRRTPPPSRRTTF